MRNRLLRDPAHSASFIEEHHEVLATFYNSTASRKHLSEEGRTLVARARIHFGYSPTTIDHDILRALLRHFEWHMDKAQKDFLTGTRLERLALLHTKGRFLGHVPPRINYYGLHDLYVEVKLTPDRRSVFSVEPLTTAEQYERMVSWIKEAQELRQYCEA